MAKVLDWRRSEDPADFIHQAVQALTEGALVVVPTDTCYIALASGLQSQAVEALGNFCGPGQTGLFLVPRSAEESADFIPSFSPGALRLARKVWPGPLIIQHGNGSPASTIDCLSESTRRRLQTEDHQVRLWQPGNEILGYISRLFSGPLVGGLPMGKQPQGKQPQGKQPEGKQGVITEVKQLPESTEVELVVIDTGSIDGIGAPTVVGIDGTVGRIVVPGVLVPEQLQALSQLLVLLVCTGNTCRSPMAAALMQKKILDRFGGTADSIPIAVTSAGVSAMGGDPASSGARQAIRNYGLNLESHQSTPIQEYMVEQADLVLVMGFRHRSILCSQWPEYADKVFMLAGDQGDISDPFGGPIEVYEHCAKQIDRHTSTWLDRFDPSSVIRWET
jgi:protein-tyrosine phosphatase